MLLDITRFPLVVLPDECRASVVVRTRSTREVSGAVLMENPDSHGLRKAGKLKEVSPTVTMSTGTDTFFETRLPLNRWDDISQFAAMFEAVSAARDSLTSSGMSWRVQIGIVRKDTGLYSVAVVDMTDNKPLVMLSVRGLCSATLVPETLPLARAAKNKLMQNEPTFWDRIAEDD